MDSQMMELLGMASAGAVIIGAAFLWLMVVIVLSLVLKAVAMWRAAKRGQKWWFVVLFVINTAGVLPLIYLLLTRGKKKRD